MLPDYSEWLTGERYAEASRHWREDRLYERYGQLVLGYCEAHDLESVLELGCGDGWLPRQLPPEIRYVGVDRNPDALDHARRLNLDRAIHDRDIRQVTPTWIQEQTGSQEVGLVCAFAVFKHFGLHEWSDVVSGALRLGRRSIFSIPLSGKDMDDGDEFHHVWVTPRTLGAAVESGGHAVNRIVQLREEDRDLLDCEVAVFTYRR